LGASGFPYSTFGKVRTGGRSTTKAGNCATEVSGRERFFIDFLYERQVTGNLEKGIPNPRPVGADLSSDRENSKSVGVARGHFTHGTGRFEKAIEASRKLIAADPDVQIGYDHVAWSLYFLDRFGEAESALQQAYERKLRPLNDLVMRYNIAVLKGDKTRWIGL